jgi:hypothetical protein
MGLKTNAEGAKVSLRARSAVFYFAAFAVAFSLKGA